MNAVRLFFAAATAGAWVVGAAVLFTAVWVIVRAARWPWRLAAAAIRWRRDTRTADPAPDLVFDQLDQELTAYAYKIQPLYVGEEGQQ